MPAWSWCFPFSILPFEPSHALASSLCSPSTGDYRVRLVGRMHFFCMPYNHYLPARKSPSSSSAAPTWTCTSMPFLSAARAMWSPSSTQPQSLLTSGPLAVLSKERPGDQELFGGDLSIIRCGDWDMSTSQWLQGFVLVYFCLLREAFCQVVERQGELICGWRKIQRFMTITTNVVLEVNDNRKQKCVA